MPVFISKAMPVLVRTKHLIAFAAVAILWLFSASSTQAVPETTLWYKQPAAKWTEALPVGSGRLGAMVFGGTREERIQFNEDTLWRGKPHDYVRAGVGDYLAQIRQLLFDGKAKEAEQLARDHFIGDPKRQMPYQPFGDIRLVFPEQGTPTEYRRELDLDGAMARTRYRLGETTFTRETFASYPDQVIVTRIGGDVAGKVNFEVALTSPHPDATITVLDGTLKTLQLQGRLSPDGLAYEARLQLRLHGGSVRTEGTKLIVQGADEAVLVLAAATSFRSFQDITADPGERCRAILARTEDRDYASLLAVHQADFKTLFDRVKLELPHSALSDLPTDERVVRVKSEGLSGDPSLAALHFNFGRYLLISCSRPGTQPANLQGIWNEELNPPWESKFTTNINFEMNYWPAELTGLSSCAEPMFDLIDDVVVSGRRTAKEQYGARGWVLHHNTDLWRGTAPVNNVDGVWTTGGAWLCYHLWEHYLFTGDREFLASRAYPVMKDAALFFVDTLVEDPRTHLLVVVPSYSPEQGTLTVGATMDQQLVRSLFKTTIEAAKLLGVDADFVAQLTEKQAKLAPNKVGQHGQLQEWQDDVDAPKNRHRHMSPLWAMYPGADITPDDPQLWDAAKVLLGWRGDGDTGWSFAWRMPLWARAGDGDVALRQLQGMFTRRTLPNLFDLCGPFQIDGNFGACAGVVEMLLQSHRRADLPDGTRRQVIDILPALPKDWVSGTVTGLHARGGFEVSIRWSAGKPTEIKVTSLNGGPCILRAGTRSKELATRAGETYVFDGELVSASR